MVSLRLDNTAAAETFLFCFLAKVQLTHDRILLKVFASPLEILCRRKRHSTFRVKKNIRVFSFGKKSWKEFYFLLNHLPENIKMTSIFIAFTDGWRRKKGRMSWGHKDDLRPWQSPKLKAWNPGIYPLLTTSHYISSFSQPESMGWGRMGYSFQTVLLKQVSLIYPMSASCLLYWFENLPPALGLSYIAN